MAIDWSDAIGAGISGLFGLGSAGAQYAMQRDLMKYQAKLNYKYAKKSTLNQYTWQRTGLENAGYNPLLALNGAEGVANTGWTSAQSAPEVNPLNSALAWQENKRQNKLAESQIDKNESEIQNNVYNSGLVYQQLLNQSLQNDFEIQKQQNNLTLQNVDTKFKLAEIGEILKRTEWMDKKTKAEIYALMHGADANMLHAMASMTGANATLLDVNSSVALKDIDKRIKQWSADHPILDRILPGSSSALTGTLGAIIMRGMKAPTGPVKNFKTSIPY